MLLKAEIKQTIDTQQSRLLRQKTYSRQILNHIKLLPNFALVVSGIRRSGKSTLLSQLIEKQDKNHYLFLNFDTPQLFNFEFSDFALLDEIIAECPEIQTLYFDEIQIIEGWELYVRGKLDQGYQVVVTGSNASLLSRELGTKLTGRHISRELFPFSFLEFCEFLGKEKNADTVADYLHLGGFPQYLQLNEDEILNALINDIIYRDIIVRFGIRDERSMKGLLLFLAGNVGNLITAGKLKQILNVKSTATVQEYLSHLEQAYVISLLPKFSYSYKIQLVNPRKVYFIDNGLQRVISPSFSQDRRRKLENAVFWALRREFSELYYYNENNKECDFVVCKNNSPLQLIQVCWQLTAENLPRERDGLIDAMNFFHFEQGTIVTFDQEDKMIVEGKNINIVPFWKLFG
ncbi:ATP-binding protein [Rodentibacter heidelbergensis]|uniref:AAA family ATPase n=1 Tax=Rodentibacter heidelbergensis TaxID=1908258 RepID=A0A1V3I9K8_9PAST|nr:ATP-binding protein [Rodentibacter heidelbergensis]OOF36517.1 AAA family ATPase [Rodentibacter heidelbergensis]